MSVFHLLELISLSDIDLDLIDKIYFEGVKKSGKPKKKVVFFIQTVLRGTKIYKKDIFITLFSI